MCTVETEVEDDVPTALLLLTVGLLIAASFLPEPSGGVLHLLYTLRSGLVCMGLCLFGAARACWRSRSLKPLAETFRALDYDTLLLLFSLFILLEGVSRAGVIDAAAQLFHSAAGDEPLHLYLLLVAASVGLSAFIDNIPYVAAMLPVVQGVAALMNGGAGIEPELFYFGLLTGATLGGNLTPIGASANIAAIGILRKNGETRPHPATSCASACPSRWRLSLWGRGASGCSGASEKIQEKTAKEDSVSRAGICPGKQASPGRMSVFLCAGTQDKICRKRMQKLF